MQFVVAQKLDRARSLRRHIAHFFDKPIDTVSDEFRHAACIGPDRRDPASHGFERGQAECLQFARHQQDVRQR